MTTSLGGIQKVIVFIAFLVPASLSLAQRNFTAMTSEDLFTAARQMSYAGNHDSARALLQLAIRKSPDYIDIRVFLARTYAWDHQWEEAKKEIGYVLLQSPDNREAISVAVDIDLWEQEPQKALDRCQRALRDHPNDEGFLVQKIKALFALHRDEEAYITLGTLQDINPSNPEIARLRGPEEKTLLSQSIMINDTYDGVNGRSASHLLYLQYQRSTVYGPFIGRVNYGRRYGYNGVQVELEGYPRIADGIYAYVNYGYSDSSVMKSALVFPKHRAGLEAFFKLPEHFECSLGARYFNFGTGNDVTLYTGTVGYYYRDYWFSIRPFITPSNVSFSRSLNLTVRYYYNGTADEYLSLKLGEGYSPDDRNYDPANGTIYFLKAHTAGIELQKPLGTISAVNARIEYMNQELAFSPGTFQNVYTLVLGYRYKF